MNGVEQKQNKKQMKPKQKEISNSVQQSHYACYIYKLYVIII